MLMTPTKTAEIAVLETDGNIVTFVSETTVLENCELEVVDTEGNFAKLWVTQVMGSDFSYWLCSARVLEGKVEPEALQNPDTARRYPRYPVSLTARLDLMPGMTAQVGNLTGEGLQLTLDDYLSPLENLEVELDLADGEQPLYLWGSVRWCHSALPHKAGIQFTGATAFQKDRIRTYLQGLRPA